jgi:hypothetical protein
MIFRIALAALFSLVRIGIMQRRDGLLPQAHCWHLAQERVSAAQWKEILQLSPVSDADPSARPSDTDRFWRYGLFGRF